MAKFDDDDDDDDGELLNASQHSVSSLDFSTHSDFGLGRSTHGDALNRSTHSDFNASVHGDDWLDDFFDMDPLAEIYFNEIIATDPHSPLNRMLPAENNQASIRPDSSRDIDSTACVLQQVPFTSQQCSPTYANQTSPINLQTSPLHQSASPTNQNASPEYLQSSPVYMQHASPGCTSPVINQPSPSYEPDSPFKQSTNTGHIVSAPSSCPTNPLNSHASLNFQNSSPVSSPHTLIKHHEGVAEQLVESLPSHADRYAIQHSGSQSLEGIEENLLLGNVLGVELSSLDFDSLEDVADWTPSFDDSNHPHHPHNKS